MLTGDALCVPSAVGSVIGFGLTWGGADGVVWNEVSNEVRCVSANLYKVKACGVLCVFRLSSGWGVHLHLGSMREIDSRAN